MKARIKFRKNGVMKFIGHLDIMRYFQKAIRRAEIPIAFTSGYSPHMIMSFANPLGVGLTSDGEYFDIELTESITSKEAVRRLNEQMVDGMEIVSFVQIPDDKKSKGMSIVAGADYLSSVKNGSLPEDLAEKLEAFYAQNEICVVKKTKKSEKEVDIRPMIYKLECRDGKIYMRVAAGSVQNLKPELVTEAFVRYLGMDAEEVTFTHHRLETFAESEDADGKILKEGVDYEVFLDDNVEIGEAWAGVHGIGDYEGLLSSTFYIVNPGSQDPEPDPSPNPRPGTDSSKSILIGSIKISGISNKIAAGKKIALKANISPANATNKTLVWTSSNPKAATVNANGIVTMKKGSGGKKVTITAKAADGSGKKAVYTITGMKGVVKKVTISGKKTVKAGKSIKLKAKVKATKKANTRLFWKSSNQKFATVKNGKVKAKKNAKGKKVKITAMATDGSGKKKSVTIKIR